MLLQEDLAIATIDGRIGEAGESGSRPAHRAPCSNAGV